MNLLKLLDIRPDAPLSITLRGRRDFCTVEIGYSPTLGVLELESVAAYLGSFSERSISHEDATAEIRHDIAALIEPDDLVIRTAWDAIEGIACDVVARG
jgi:NADPH-dependent 7-cyano-7-deazaguanine reductase QueF